MSGATTIEWTDRTWNPVTGCTKVSAGCDHCYAETMHERFNGKGSFARVRHHSERLHLPQRWRKPARIFVNSMSDLFHDAIPASFIAEVWAVMATTPRHTFQVLTKRHARMRSLLTSDDFWALVAAAVRARGLTMPGHHVGGGFYVTERALPNVWLGVSIENQQWADIRIPALLATPAAVRWVSAEPLLGPIDLKLVSVSNDDCTCSGQPYGHERHCGVEPGEHWGIDWVVAGGESGTGARPADPQWFRTLRDECGYVRVPFLFKQWGAHDETGRRVGKKAAGRLLDGRVHDDYPEVLAS